MYKKIKPNNTTINCNNSYQGETIEAKIRRIMSNKEPISDGSPLIYTERKEGVQPAYNIKTDRWEVALDAMDTVSKIHTARREERMKAKEEIIKDIEGKTNTGGESIQA